VANFRVGVEVVHRYRTEGLDAARQSVRAIISEVDRGSRSPANAAQRLNQRNEEIERAIRSSGLPEGRGPNTQGELRQMIGQEMSLVRRGVGEFAQTVTGLTKRLRDAGALGLKVETPRAVRQRLDAQEAQTRQNVIAGLNNLGKGLADVVTQTNAARRATAAGGGGAGGGIPPRPTRPPEDPDDRFNRLVAKRRQEIEAEAQQRRIAAKRETAVLGTLNDGGEYARVLARQRLERERLARATESGHLQSLTPGDIRGRAGLQFTRENINRQQQIALETLRNDQQVLSETARLASLKKQRRIAEERATLAANALNVRPQAELEVLQRQRRAQQQLAGVQYLNQNPLLRSSIEGNEAAVAAARKRQSAAIEARTQEELAGDQSYIDATARAKIARQRQAARIQAEVERLTTPQDTEARVGAAVNRRVRQANESILVNERILRNEKGELDAIVRRQALERDLNQAIEKRVREQRLAQNQGNQILPGGSTFQRIQALLHARQSGDVADPTQFQGFAQFLGSKALTTAGFAASSALLYGGLQAVKDIVRETEQLQRVMAAVKAQFDSIGSGRFKEFRSEILEISRDTGVAADEVATVAFQMRGAFGNTTKAVQETRAAIRASIVTGIEQKELTDSLTGAAISYGVSIEDITDKAIGLEERFGVLARESLKVFGDMSSSAQSAGLSLNEIAAIIGVIQQRSGRSGSSIAEGLNRVLPAIQGNAAKIIGIYQQVPGLAGNLGKIQEAIKQGDTGDVLIELVRDFDKLDATTQKYLKSLLGGRREAQLLDPLFAGRIDILRELGRTEDDAGKTTERFGAIQSTLTQTFARMREELRQIGDSLARSGLLDAFKVIFGGMEIGIRIVGFLTREFANMNEFLGSVPGKLLAMAAAIGLVVAAMKAWAAVSSARALVGAITGRLAATGVATGVGATGSAAAGGAVGQTLASGLFIPVGAAKIEQEIVKRTLRQRLAAQAGRFGNFASGPLPGPIGGLDAGFNNFGIGGQSKLGQFLGATPLRTAITSVAIGTATMVAIDYANMQFKRLQGDQADAAKIDTETFSGKSLGALLDIKEGGDYGNAKSGFFSSGVAGRALRLASGDLSALYGGKDGEGAAAFLTGNTTGNEKLQGFIDAATFSAFGAAKDAGLFDKLPKKRIEELTKELDKSEGGGKAGKEAIKLLRQVGALTDRGIMDAAARAAATTGKVAVEQTRADKGASRVQTVEDLQSQFQQGKVNYNDLIEGIQLQLEGLKAADDGTIPELHQQVLALETQLQQTISQKVQQAAQLVQTLQTFAGESPEAQLRSLTAVLGTAQVKNDPNLQLQIAQQAAQTQQQAFQNAITNAPDAETALRLGEGGSAMDPATRQAFIEAQTKIFGRVIYDPTTLKADANQIKALKQAVVQEKIAELQADQGAFLSPALQAKQARQIAELQYGAATNDTERAQARIAINNADKQAYQVGIDQRRAALERQKAETQDPVKQAQIEYDLARLQLEEARKTNDPAAIDRAHAAISQARETARDAQNDIARANLELMRAQDPEDAIAQASIAQQEADQAAREAVGQAAQARALAQRIAADKQMRDALFELGKAQTDLLRAMMERTGDMVGIAQLNLDDARRELERLRAEGAGPSEIQRQENEVFRQETALGDARLNDILERIQFRLDMDEITKQQAIAELQGALALADSEQERRQILRQIKQLTDSAGTDLQFDLPTNLKLPTLYEARRLNQSGPGGYQDNRQISVTLQVTPETYDSAFTDAQALVQAPPNRFRNGGLY
jgi:hypothetical protein